MNALEKILEMNRTSKGGLAIIAGALLIVLTLIFSEGYHPRGGLLYCLPRMYIEISPRDHLPIKYLLGIGVVLVGIGFLTRYFPSNREQNIVNRNEELLMKHELIDTFLDGPSEYMPFHDGLKKNIKKVSPDGNCVASLKREEGKYLYKLTWKDGRYVGEYVRPFHPTESNIQKFNQGCAECARLLRIYLETGDISKVPMGPAFGELSCEWEDGQPADMDANFDKGGSNDLQTDKHIMNGLNKIRESFLKRKGIQSADNKDKPDADSLAHFLMNQLFDQFDLGEYLDEFVSEIPVKIREKSKLWITFYLIWFSKQYAAEKYGNEFADDILSQVKKYLRYSGSIQKEMEGLEAVFEFYLNIVDKAASYTKAETFAAKGLLVFDPNSPYYKCRETNGVELIVGRAFKSAKDKAKFVIHNAIDKGILVKELYR